jgi:hypothetical protein
VNRNVAVALAPFILPDIDSVSADDGADLVAENFLDDTHPGLPWRAPDANVDHYIIFDFLAATALNAAFLNRTNYPAIKLLKSADKTNWNYCTPNLLLWSWRPRRTAGSGAVESPWSSTGSLTAVTSTQRGPFRRQAPYLLTFGSGATMSQSATIGTGSISAASRLAVATVWLRMLSGTGSFTLSVTPSGGGSATYSATLGVSSNVWTRFTLPASFVGGDSGTAVTWKLTSPTAQQVLFGGAAFAMDMSGAPLADYETNGDGLVVPRHNWVGRRKVLLDLGNYSNRYLKYFIPANQTTDDGTDQYDTGAITLTAEYGQWAGGHQFPITPSLSQAATSKEFDGGAKEFNQLGERKAFYEFSGPFVSEVAEDDIEALLAIGVGKTLIFYPNTRDGGSPVESMQPEKAFLMRRISDARLAYGLPEAFDFGLSLEEVI